MVWIIIIWLAVLIFLLMIVRSAAHSVDDSMQAMIDEEQSRYIDQYFKEKQPRETDSATAANELEEVENRDVKFIVIEGLDGSGKATQAKLLATHLVDVGKTVKQVSFPDYDSDSSSLVKMYLNGEFGDKPGDVNAYAASAFYAVDRYASWKKNWSHDLEESGFVIADRYTTSNAIHQCSKLSEEEWDEYLPWLFDFEYNKLDIPEPDLVIYLRVEPEVSQKLLSERYHGDMKREDIHEKDAAYLLRCQRAADYCASHLGWHVIDCCENDKMRSIEDIHNEILRTIGEIKDGTDQSNEMPD